MKRRVTVTIETSKDGRLCQDEDNECPFCNYSDYCDLFVDRKGLRLGIRCNKAGYPMRLRRCKNAEVK